MLYQPKTQEEFEKILEENNNVVVDFSASWCPACQMYLPIFMQVSGDVKTAMVTIDVDDLSSLSNEWGISSIPTTVFVKNNSETKRESGFIPADKLKNLIEGM